MNLTVDGSGTVAISGAIGTTTGTLTKNGAGTLSLSGANSYTGATTVSAGTLVVGSSAALGDTSGATSVTSGATLQLGAYSIGEPLTINGTGVSSAGALYFSAGGTVTGTVALGSASTIQVASTYTGTI
ncbi:MAG: autotransporter-associated beta strand, partial [Gammaproteobacteria bacterium]|nr:autotransporter-associated beta strand [Gammaproteobacteria bacterium]